jgi:predicted DNA-binding protein (UPF0251 family)
MYKRRSVSMTTDQSECTNPIKPSPEPSKEPKRRRITRIKDRLKLLDHEPQTGQPEVVLLNPHTGEAHSVSALDKVNVVTPQMEYAIRLYATGKFSETQAAHHANVSMSRFNVVLNSPPGQAILTAVRGALEVEFQAQFKKVIEVIGDALDHQDPSIALAGANLWLRSCRKQEIKVDITAEDLVQKIMGG